MPDVSKMISVADLKGRKVIRLAREARKFLAGFSWCKTIDEQYLAWAIAPIVSVFFFRITPSRLEVDTELWVVVGDLPPAYLICDNAHTWQQALDAYGVEMMEWVKAVHAGKSVEKIIPVNVPPTQQYADMLESRIKTIWEKFVDVPPETLPTDT